MTERKLANSVNIIKKIAKILLSKAKIMRDGTKINSEMTVRLCLNTDILPKLLSEKRNRIRSIIS